VDCPNTIEDYEKNTYPAAMFGAAGCWMTQNLRVKKYTNGTSLSQGSNSSSDYTSKYYNCPNLNSSAPAEYGLLYSWAAATNRTSHVAEETNNSNQTQYQGICPAGWHLPSDYEWNQLEQVIAESAAGVYSTDGATTWNTSYSTDTGYRGAHGQKMKSKTAVNGTNPNGTSNSSTAKGFNALLVGYVASGSAGSSGAGARFWSSSSNDSSSAWYRTLGYSDTGVYRGGSNNKYYMFSVRCKKN
jgi:uncharacterized protein (TIGR02145 family)